MGMGTRAQNAADMAIALAIEKGQYEFIDVKLLDTGWKETLGWHKVISVRRLNTETQMDEYVVAASTGALVFKYDEIRSGFYAKVLNDKAGENRKRLAANTERFLIVDEKLRKEIIDDSKPKTKELKSETAKAANVKPDNSLNQEATELPIPETTEEAKATKTDDTAEGQVQEVPEVPNKGAVKTPKSSKAKTKEPTVSAWAQQQQEAAAIPGEGTIIKTETNENS